VERLSKAANDPIERAIEDTAILMGQASFGTPAVGYCLKMSLREMGSVFREQKSVAFGCGRLRVSFLTGPLIESAGSAGGVNV
jgi:hypothetical protein